MTFFVRLHQPSDCRRFRRSFVSVNRLRTRRGDFRAQDWILDSGAFSELARFGRYREGVEDYAAQIERWSRCGNLLAAVTQDYMCDRTCSRKPASPSRSTNTSRSNATARCVSSCDRRT